LAPALCAAQTVQNATLRKAQQAYDNLDFRLALSGGQAALRERLTGFERARAYELLGFTYSGMDSNSACGRRVQAGDSARARARTSIRPAHRQSAERVPGRPSRRCS